MYQDRCVATSFLTVGDRILLLKRRDSLNAYPGRWTTVSGAVSGDPYEEALLEVEAETGLTPSEVALLREGEPWILTDERLKTRWEVHAYLFGVASAVRPRLGSQHADFVWLEPARLPELHTVPLLAETLERVWPPPAEEEEHAEPVPVPSKGVAPPPPSPRPTRPAESPPESQQPGQLPGQQPGQQESSGPTDLAELPPTLERALEKAKETSGIKVRILKARIVPEEPSSPPQTKLHVPASSTSREALLTDPEVGAWLELIRADPSQSGLALVHTTLQALRAAAFRSSSSTPEAWLQDLARVALVLANLRPHDACVGHSASRLLYQMRFERTKEKDLARLRSTLEGAAEQLEAQLRLEQNRAALSLQAHLSSHQAVMLYGYHPVFVEAFHDMPSGPSDLIVPELRPTFDGRRLARALLSSDKTCTLIAEAAMASLLPTTSVALLATRTFRQDGSVLVPAGGLLLALAAEAMNVPVLAVGPLWNLELSPNLSHQSVEEHPPEELWDEALPGLVLRNLALEPVPPRLLAGVVTEEGVLSQDAFADEVVSRRYLWSAISSP